MESKHINIITCLYCTIEDFSVYVFAYVLHAAYVCLYLLESLEGKIVRFDHS